MLLLTLTLTLSMPGWAAKEAGVAGEEQEPAAAAGKEEAKEDECPATFGPIIGDTAVPIAKGKFAIQPTWGLFFVTDAFPSSWRRVSPGGNYTGFNQLVKVSYGLWDNLEVNVVMNTYEHAWARNVNEPGPKGERAADFGSIGNTLLTFQYQFIQEGPTVPNVTGVLSTAFPTGHYRQSSYRAGLSVSRR